MAYVDSLIIEDVEEKLYVLLLKLDKDVREDVGSQKYIDALAKLVQLKSPIDDFFDKVMVNAEDAELKKNRHNMLRMLHQVLNRVADISKLST